MLVRRVFFGLAALSLAVLVFIAGYAAYPLLHQGSLPTVTPPGSDVAEGEAEMGKYWQVWELLDRDFFGDKPDAAKRTDGAIAGMVQTFNDPYTFFVEPQTRELERDQLAGKFGGIGANLEQTDAGYVLSPLAGQPADQAGVRKGDLLLMVDGHEVTPQMTTDEVIALLRGPVGSSITLVVRRSGTGVDTAPAADSGAAAAGTAAVSATAPLPPLPRN